MELEIHDPSTGLHDIKPPPEFYLFPTEILWLCAAGLLLILFLVLRPFLRRSPAPLNTPSISAFAIFKAQIEELRSALKRDSLNQREFASTLSLTIRGFLEASFALPATDLTNREIEDELDALLCKTLPTLPSQTRETLQRDHVRILRKCEKLSFQATRYASQDEESESLLRESVEQVKALHYWLEKETERTRSVVV